MLEERVEAGASAVGLVAESLAFLSVLLAVTASLESLSASCSCLARLSLWPPVKLLI